MRRIGGYSYVLEKPVYYPLSDCTFCSLVYATRAAAGVEGFRDCHVATLKQQANRRAEAKFAARVQRSGQDEMQMGAQHRVAPRPSDSILASAEAASRSMMIDIVGRRTGGIRFKDLRLQVLEREIIGKQKVGELAAELRKSGLIDFPGWECGRRVPQDNYLTMAPP